MPPPGAAVPGAGQRRAGQGRPDQPGRRLPSTRPTWPAASTRSAAAPRRWRRSSTSCARRSPTAIAGGAKIILLSDRHSNAELAPIPSLLFTAAVHHHLVREKTRTQVGLVVEAGDVREVHHVALLIGYGAAAVNPYLAIESVEDLARHGVYTSVDAREGRRQRRQGARQGRAQGDDQDGRLHRRLLHRRADLRGARAVARRSSTATSPAPPPSWAGSPWSSWPRRSAAATCRPTRPTASRWRTARCRSAGSTSGAARASRTCSTPRRCSGCSTPPARAATTSSSSTPRTSTPRPSG